MGVKPGHKSLKPPYFSVIGQNLDEVQNFIDKRFIPQNHLTEIKCI